RYRGLWHVQIGDRAGDVVDAPRLRTDGRHALARGGTAEGVGCVSRVGKWIRDRIVSTRLRARLEGDAAAELGFGVLVGITGDVGNGARRSSGPSQEGLGERKRLVSRSRRQRDIHAESRRARPDGKLGRSVGGRRRAATRCSNGGLIDARRVTAAVAGGAVADDVGGLIQEGTGCIRGVTIGISSAKAKI